MSLVHPSIVGCLNRRFVSTYYDVYPGPGHDAEGVAFAASVAERAAQSLRYGAIVTADGVLVAAFGFHRDEVVAAMRQALASHPDLARPSDEEQSILDAAAARPHDIRAQLRAAALECDLLLHDAARARLSRLLASEMEPTNRAAIGAAHAHAGVLHLGERDLDALRRQLQGLTDVPSDWRDDVVADLVSLDVMLGKADFFGGWRFREGVDVTAHRKAIEAELVRAPRSDRVGELRFLLGLCHMAVGNRAAADAVFAAHAADLPDDRYSLLSRLHHSGYSFHPTDKAPQGGNLADPAVAAKLRTLLGENANVQILTPDGRARSGEEARAFLDGRLPAPSGAPAAVEPTATTATARDNFRLPAGMATTPAAALPDVEVVGTGPVPLLLVPGQGFDAGTTYGEFASRQGDRYQSHLVRLPGFGGVPPWPVPADPMDFHEHTWTRAAVDAICERARSLDRPIVVGHFLGGAEIALRAAIEHPERFAGVVVVTTEPSRSLGEGDEPQTSAERRTTVDARWQPFFRTVTQERWQRGLYPAPFYSRDEERGKKLWQESANVPVEIMVRWFLEYQCCDSALRVAELKVPMLAMEPDQQASHWWQSWAGIEARFPAAPVTVQPWKGRASRAFPMLDAPDWFAEHLAAFVAQHRQPK